MELTVISMRTIKLHLSSKTICDYICGYINEDIL